ncbi:MAG: DUF427 domain-containing protein [bacterium]|nr:DUF427 domain-containing protein [bacterium]
MADIIDEHEAARRLSMTVEEVIYRLDYGQMMGVEVDGGWRIDTRDLESFRRGQALGRAIAAAGKAPVDSKSPEDFQEISADESPGWRRNPEYEIDLAIVPARVEARCAGATVAASGRTLTVMELGHGAVYYMPRDDVDWSCFAANTHSTYCQYKGFACYWTLQVDSRVEENVIWAYDEPHREVSRLKDHVGFYWHRMDAWLEDGTMVESPRDIAGRCDARHSFRALYPELARQWHSEKNPNINPYECAPWFHACVWWQDDTGREWRQSIRDRVLGHPAP